MKAVLQDIKAGNISVDDIPRPLLKPGTVLVRNVCSLVSAGTEKAVLEFSKANYLNKARQRPDLFRKVLNKAKNDGFWQTYKVVSNLIDQPIQLGYSCAGVAMEVGDEIDDIQAGQPVACAGLFVATHSEVVSTPRNLLAPIPEGLGFEEASFVTLGAIAMQGVRLAGLELGENVVVYGLGLVGMLTAQLALAAGCRVMGIDIDPAKLKLARDLGCQVAAAGPGQTEAVLGFSGGYGADKVILCAATKSNEPVEKVPEFTRQKGVLVVVGDVGLNIPRRPYYDKEIDLRISRSYGPGRYDLSYEEGGIDYPYAYVRWTENRNMVSFLDLAARGRLEVGSLITHRLDIDQATRAYEIIEGKIKEPYLGMVLHYGREEAEAPTAAKVEPQPSRPLAGELNLGVVGAGAFAKAFLLPAFSAVEGVKIAGVCTAGGVSSAAVAKKYSCALATSDPREIFDAPDIQAVIIATRHDVHADYAVQALRAGKAVFLEKPLALNLAELERVARVHRELTAQGENPFLMVGFNRRFSPLALRLREAFAGRREPLAMVYRVNAGFIPPEEWVHDPRLGGGRIIGECCHFVDFMQFITGEDPRAVSVNALRKGDEPVRDTAAINLEFSEGSLGSIQYLANGNPGLPKEYIEVFGSGKSAVLTNFRNLKLYGAKVKGRTRYFNQVKGFEQEAQAFVQALRAGEPSPIGFQQLYLSALAVFMAERALSSGRKEAIGGGAHG